jgi:hypothetical protein
MMLSGFKLESPNNDTLNFFIETSINEFYKNDQLKSKRFEKICKFFQNRESLLIAHRHDNEKLVASCFVFVRWIILDGVKVKCAFLSQVIVQESFRGTKVLYGFFQDVENSLQKFSIPLYFIVARKGVDYMYNKLGFIGFSNFTNLIFEGDFIDLPGKLSESNFVNFDNLSILEIQESYSDLVSNEPISLVRETDYWELILTDLDLRNILTKIFCDSDGNKIYLFYAGNKLIDFYPTFSVDYSILHRVCAQLNLKEITISQNNPYFEGLKKIGWRSTSRPTRFGGHLLKINQNAVSPCSSALHGLNSLNLWYLNELNQLHQKGRLDCVEEIKPMNNKSINLQFFDEI